MSARSTPTRSPHWSRTASPSSTTRPSRVFRKVFRLAARGREREDDVRHLGGRVELREVPDPGNGQGLRVREQRSQGTALSGAQIRIELPEGDANRGGERRELRFALRVRNHGRGEIGVESEEGLERARLRLELTVEKRHELLSNGIVANEAADLEVVQPTELSG